MILYKEFKIKRPTPKQIKTSAKLKIGSTKSDNLKNLLKSIKSTTPPLISRSKILPIPPLIIRLLALLWGNKKTIEQITKKLILSQSEEGYKPKLIP